MESLGLELEKLVYSVVNKYGYGRNDIEDLYQIGMQGLEEAKKKSIPVCRCHTSSASALESILREYCA